MTLVTSNGLQCESPVDSSNDQLSPPVYLYITQGRTVRLGGATAAPVMVDAASPPPGVDLALCTPDPSNNRCCVDIVSHTL